MTRVNVGPRATLSLRVSWKKVLKIDLACDGVPTSPRKKSPRIRQGYKTYKEMLLGQMGWFSDASSAKLGEHPKYAVLTSAEGAPLLYV